MASLYERTDLYDLVAPRDAAMETHYRDAALANGPRVLELACGSGRFTVPLASAGLQVTGIDLSEPMLGRARARAATQHVQIELLAGDMRDFDLGRQFETVMIAANSIMHLLDADDFRRFFAAVARHLPPTGRLMFDCFVPSIALLARPGERQSMTTVQHTELGALSVEEVINYDAVSQVADARWFWSAEGRPDFAVMDIRMRQIFPQELPSLLEANGFRLLERFGDFEHAPFGAASWRQVCISAAA